jgi:hypothetical protein
MKSKVELVLVFTSYLVPRTSYLFLSLTLLVTWILLVDHVQFTFTAHDFTIDTAFLNCCSYFHICPVFAFAVSLQKAGL